MLERTLDIHFFTVSQDYSGQRIDNFLKSYLKSVPRSMIYRIIRTGKVRINQKKVRFYYKLEIGDLIKIASIQKVKIPQVSVCSKQKIILLKKSIIYEDDYLMALNKPSGIAVHSGSGLQFNIIDGLRYIFYSKIRFLELVHRLDRAASGVLLVAKNRSVLISLQKQWKLNTIKKEYLALVYGEWDSNITSISVPVLKNDIDYSTNIIDADFINLKNKKIAKTYFQVKESFNKLVTFLKIHPITGRYHQIRTHTKSVAHPIIGDWRYGNYQINNRFKKLGFNRLFLHASKLCFVHPNTKKSISIHAPINRSFSDCLFFLRKNKIDDL